MARRTDDDDAEDEKLWLKVASTVRPLARKKPATPKPGSPKPVSVKMSRHETPPPSPPRISPPKPPAKGFDRATETKLKKGKLPLEARLDLHGLSQERAYAALHRFIRRAGEEGVRTVLIITGKGRVGGGVLRRMVPLWLEEGDLSRIVLGIAPAQPKDGGDGALYVRLRNLERK